MKIRPATEVDAPAIIDILREVGWFEPLNRSDPQASAVRAARMLRQTMSDESWMTLVAESDGGEVIGYLSIHWLQNLMYLAPEGYISELFIRESARGEGVGRALLDTAERQARERGCCRLILLNGRSRPSYERGFYTKCGWTERPTVANFILPLGQKKNGA